MGILAFFLPWVRPVSLAQSSDVLNVANQLAESEDSIFNSWLGMREEEWRVFFQRPTFGLSGFQMLMLESEKSIMAKEAQAWLGAVFGDRRLLDRAVNVLPLVILLLTAAFISPRKPVRQAFVTGGVLLLLFYLWARWRLDVTYTQRVLAEMEIAYGLWITLYAMLGMAILAIIRFLSPKGKW
jgi:hypothetical protein